MERLIRFWKIVERIVPASIRNLVVRISDTCNHLIPTRNIDTIDELPEQEQDVAKIIQHYKVLSRYIKRRWNPDFIFFDAAVKVLWVGWIYSASFMDCYIQAIPESVKELFRGMSRYIYAENIQKSKTITTTQNGLRECLEMVTFEQWLVEDFLRENDISEEDIDALNTLINIPTWIHPVFQVAKSIITEDRLEFTNSKHRVLIGKLYVLYTFFGAKEFVNAPFDEKWTIMKTYGNIPTMYPIGINELYN